MLEAVGLIAERVVRRLVVAVKRQRAEALIAEGSLNLSAAVERSDGWRVEDEIRRRARWFRPARARPNRR